MEGNIGNKNNLFVRVFWLLLYGYELEIILLLVFFLVFKSNYFY